MASAAHRELPGPAGAVREQGCREAAGGAGGPGPHASQLCREGRGNGCQLDEPTGKVTLGVTSHLLLARGRPVASGSLEPGFFLGCGPPPPLQDSRQAPGILGPRAPAGLGPGPHSRDPGRCPPLGTLLSAVREDD